MRMDRKILTSEGTSKTVVGLDGLTTVSLFQLLLLGGKLFAGWQADWVIVFLPYIAFYGTLLVMFLGFLVLGLVWPTRGKK